MSSSGPGRWIYEFYRHNRGGVHVALLLTVLASLVEVVSIALYYPVFALLTGTPVAEGVASRLLARAAGLVGQPPALAAVLAVLVGLVVVRAVCLYVARVVSNRYELRFQLQLKQDFLRRFAASTWAFVIQHKSGSLLNIFSQYTGDASRGLFCLLEFLIDLVACLAYVSFALFVSPALAAFIVVAGLVAGPLLRWIYRLIRSLVAERIQVQDRLADKFLDYLRGFKTFKSMGIEALYLRELGRDLSTFTDNARRSYGAQLALAQVGEPLFAVVGALFLLVAYYWFRVGMETIIIFFALLTRTYSRLSSLQVNLGRLVGHTPAIRACVEFDALARAAAEPEAGRPLTGPIATIELDHVGFVYPDGTRVFENVSLRLGVDRGLIALVGPSGAGKSTLLDLFAGLLRPTEGVFRINGIDVREIDLRALRARVGVVPQSPILFNRSVRENISLREEALTDAARVEEAARQADAHEFITRLPEGYDARMGDDGASLSVGQIQRLSIARALYQQPEIMFFDEPTSALDPASTTEVMSVIERIAERYPVFLITHSPEVRRHAQWLLFLDEGRLRVAEPAAAEGRP